MWLVGKPQTSKVGPFERPHRKGTYTLTDFEQLTEEQFLSRVRGEEVILLLACMDKDFAEKVYRDVQHANKDKLIIHMFCAGGAAQWDSEIRTAAMATLVTYVCQNANVVQIVATAHTDGCGGLAKFAFEGQPVPMALDCKPNASRERNFVKGRVDITIPVIVPDSHRGRVNKYLVGHRDRPSMTPF